MQQVLGVVTIVLVGLMVGVEFAVAVFVNRIFDRLPEAHGLAARSDGARVLGRVMPVWYIASTALSVLWAVLDWGQPHCRIIAIAAGLLVVSIVMSLVLLVPINSRVARWAAGEAPADWRRQIGRWNRWHYLRVAIIVAAFVLLVIAD
ncbi:MAG TPA: DUF1772 domain-containing protein [Pseudonocardiaceae bacterium]|jgi:uncharacterized membrane protein|nr:DUF1772 domain-containing protein [Pseudonocardiaceae bacterium]